MSQYDREGAGMNCGGRNQFGIKDEDITGLREQMRRRRTVQANSDIPPQPNPWEAVEALDKKIEDQGRESKPSDKS